MPLLEFRLIKTPQSKNVGLYPEKVHIVEIDDCLYAVGDSALRAFMEGKELDKIKVIASEVPVILGLDGEQVN